MKNIDFSWFNFSILNKTSDFERRSAVKDLEAQALAELRRETNALGAANPLKSVHTKIPYASITSYSNAFKLSAPGKGLWHFCYTCGAEDNIDWLTWGELKNGLGFSSFGRFINSVGPDNDVAVLNGNVTDPGEKSWHWSNHTEQPFQNTQGIWLGTLDMTGTAKEMLKKVYGGNCPCAKWEKDAWMNEEVNGGWKPRLLSLKTMVYLGITLGA